MDITRELANISLNIRDISGGIYSYDYARALGLYDRLERCTDEQIQSIEQRLLDKLFSILYEHRRCDRELLWKFAHKHVSKGCIMYILEYACANFRKDVINDICAHVSDLGDVRVSRMYMYGHEHRAVTEYLTTKGIKVYTPPKAKDLFHPENFCVAYATGLLENSGSARLIKAAWDALRECAHGHMLYIYILKNHNAGKLPRKGVYKFLKGGEIANPSAIVRFFQRDGIDMATAISRTGMYTECIGHAHNEKHLAALKIQKWWKTIRKSHIDDFDNMNFF